MNAQRDELAGIAMEQATANGMYMGGVTAENMADAILAAGYRKPLTIDNDKLVIDDGLLLLDVGSCTCSPYGASHERHCGVECLDDLTKPIQRAGYTKPRTITTAEEIRDLPALTIVVYDDSANGGLLQTYVVPDDGTVMFKDRYPFHLMTFAGDYVKAEDMPLPLTVVYEVGA